MTKYEKWLGLKASIKDLTERLHELEGEIWTEAKEKDLLNMGGSKTFDDSGFKVTITHGSTVKVDQELAAAHSNLFKAKYEFDKKAYDDLAKEFKDIVNEAITITPSKPQFKVVAI